jgi:hypothetical protein
MESQTTDNSTSQVDNAGTVNEQTATRLEDIMLNSDGTTAEKQPETKLAENTQKSENKVDGTNIPAWMSQLPSELQGENGKSLEKFQKLGDLAKSYVELEKKMSDRVAVPNENSTEAEVKAFWQKMGKPEKAEDYKFSEKLDPESAKFFNQLAYDSNLTQEQAQKVFGDQAKLGEQMMSKYRDNQLQQLKTTEANLRTKFGNNFDKEMEFCRRGLVSSGLAKVLKETGLSGNQAIVEHFIQYGKMIAEDSTVVKGSGGTAEKSLLDGGLLL